MRDVDRQRLVDFINTLEEMSCSHECERLWVYDASFWRWYTEQHLKRARFYLDELDISIGIELEQKNWSGVRQTLSMLVENAICGETSAEQARRVVQSASDISVEQRDAFLSIIAFHEEQNYDICVAWRP